MTRVVEAREDPRLGRTRAKALTAARQALFDLGFAEVTIEDISVRSGVSRSTLYRHWRTKEEILRDAFSDVAVSAPSPGRDLTEELRHYAQAVVNGMEGSWGRAAATLATTALEDPEQRRVLRTFIDGYSRDIDVLLRRAIERGEPVAEPYDAERIADEIFAPLYYRYLFRQEPLDARLRLRPDRSGGRLPVAPARRRLIRKRPSGREANGIAPGPTSGTDAKSPRADGTPARPRSPTRTPGPRLGWRVR